METFFILEPSLVLESSHDFFAGDRVLSDPYSAGVVNGVGKGSGNSADAGFAETLNAVEPAGLQAVDEQLCLLRRVHDGRQAIGKVTDAVVPGAGEFPVPWDRVGSDLSAFDQRSHHVGFRYQWVDHDARIVRIDGSYETPVAGPGVHFDLGEAGSDAFVGSAALVRRRRLCRWRG